MAKGLLASVARFLFGRAYALSSAAVDPAYYRKFNRSTWAKLFPAAHYWLFGWRRGRDPNAFFQTDWYLQRYADARGTNPLLHYLRFGVSENRDPGPAFETAWYLARYPDVSGYGVSPLIHFLRHGRHEGRQPKPPAILRSVVGEASWVLGGGVARHRVVGWSASIGDVAGRGIVFDGAAGVWRALGNDPQFHVAARVEAGFLRVRLELGLHGMRRAVAGEACLQVFFDHGAGFSPAAMLSYPIAGDRFELDDLVFVDRDLVAIRIDPVNSACAVSVSVFALESVPLEAAVPVLERAFLARGGTREAFLALDVAGMRAFIDTVSRAQRPPADPYAAWLAARRIDAAALQRLRAEAAALPERPRIAILLPTYRSDLRFLDQAIQSVRAQVYPDWELCIVDDGSDDPRLAAYLDRQRQADPRIRVRMEPRNGGIALATNHALAMAGAEFVALLDHDDEMAPEALLRVAQAILRHPEADMIYSDEDKIDAEGVRHDPFFKPDWSPEFFLGCMYTCHLGVYRRALLQEIGGFRSAYDLAQDYDIALRTSARARQIVHIPEILYHWRTLPSSTAASADAKPAAERAARAALQDHVDATALRGTVVPGPFAGSHRVKLAVIGEPLVSLVIPTAARRIDPGRPRWFLLDLLVSIHAVSTYRRFEIVLVDNGDIEPALQARLGAFALRTVTTHATQFNYSDKVNRGVAAAQGEFVILLNDDMTVITPGWIEELIGWLQRPGIAAVGAKLLFPDATVQHAGVLLLGQGPSHAGYGAGDADPGQAGSAVLVRNFSAVTAACLAVRKADYDAVGGFDPAFRVNYNDVDFCLRLRARGRIVYTPFAKLYHYESVSRDEAPAEELAMFNSKWEGLVGFDPYYNPNLSQYAPYQVRPVA